MLRAQGLFGRVSGFARNLITLMTGTATAQALSVLAAPILARLYAPADFGMLALFVAIVSIVGIISCGRYELSIALPSSDEDAANVLAFSILLGVATCALALLMVAFFRHPLAAHLGTPDLARWCWLVPVSLLGTAAYQPASYWVLRRRQFRVLAASRVAQSGTSAAGQLSAGAWFGAGPGGLILGQLGGQLGAALVLVALLRRLDRAIAVRVTPARMGQVAIRYARFPKFSTGSSLLHSLSEHLPALMLGHAFGPAFVGFYAIAQRLANAPINLVASSTSQVFLPRAAEARRRGGLERQSLSVFRRCLEISLVPTFILMFIATDLVAFLLGDSWRESGLYLRYLGIWMMFSFPFITLSQLFAVLEKQRECLLYNVAYGSAVFAALSIGNLVGDPHVAILLFALLAGAARAWACFWLLLGAGVPLSVGLRTFLSKVIAAVPYVGVLVFTKIVAPPEGGILLVSFLVLLAYMYRVWRVTARRERTP